MLLHRVQSLGKAKVSQENMVGVGEEHILRLDVAMDHAVLVHVIHSAANLDKYLTSLVFSKPSLMA